MSNVYRFSRGLSYYQVPHALDESLSYIKSAELKLLLYVQSEAERRSRSKIVLTGTDIAKATGIHPTSVGEARKGLVTVGLLVAEKRGANWTYVVCDPRDRTPVPDGREPSDVIDFDALTSRILRSYFRPHLRQCKPTANGLTGCCPFPTHKDDTPSFCVSLEEGSGGLWNCMGCHRSGKLVDFELCLSETAAGVTIDRQTAHTKVVNRLHALGVAESTTGKYDIVYTYHDEYGEVNSETVRIGGDKKNMARRRPHPDKPGRYIPNTKGCKPLLYRLPEVMEADTVILVEGEPDAEAVRSLSLQDEAGRWIAATTTPYGAGSWKPEYTEQLRGKTVICIGHNDPDGKGLKHMHIVQDELEGTVKRVSIRSLPSEFKDVHDYLKEHADVEFIRLVGDGLLELPPSI